MPNQIRSMMKKTPNVARYKTSVFPNPTILPPIIDSGAMKTECIHDTKYWHIVNSVS